MEATTTLPALAEGTAYAGGFTVQARQADGTWTNYAEAERQGYRYVAMLTVDPTDFDAEAEHLTAWLQDYLGYDDVEVVES